MFSKFFNNYISQKNFFFLILLALVVWFIWNNPDVGFMIFASLLFACSLAPLTKKLSKKMKPELAATVVITGLILIILLFVLPVLALGAYQITTFAEEFPNYISNLDNLLDKSPLARSLHVAHIDIESIVNSLAQSSSSIMEYIMNFIASFGSAFLYIFTTIVFIFFFLTDQENIRKGLLNLFPSELRNRADELGNLIVEKLGGYVLAQTLVSGSVWITMTIGLLLFKINYAIILGLVAGIMSIIPVLGSAISLVICLIATYESGWIPMLIVAILFTISHFVENNVVRPYVYSKMLDLHPAIIFLALLVGAKYAGVMGVLFAPPIAMALCILLDELYIKKMDK